MDYFITSSETHNLRFLHRVYEPIVTLTLWHELTNTKSVISGIECELSDGYSLITFDFNFILNGTYTLEITNNSTLIYRSKAKAV
ncbi:hypothetical protein [Flavobacterium sp.]|uniref:hypothetical protein n=1 Tax=Flavobacterium sp. TaxID=239 RepID=UPI003341234F